MQEQLLGYLLGALDEAQHAAVQSALEANPALAAECARLEQTIAPLSEDEAWLDPPPRLAERTVAFVEASRVREAKVVDDDFLRQRVSILDELLVDEPRESHKVQPASLSPVSGLETIRTRRWSLADAMVAAGICAAAAILLFPAIANSRQQAAVTQCQNNLRQIGQALVGYSYGHDGQFPLVPADGNLGVAGVYAPILKESGRITNDNVFLCPGSALAEDANTFRIPRTEEVLKQEGKALLVSQQKMGGSFGYAFGYEDDNKSYQANTNRSRPRFAILADAPSLHLKDRQSDNHNGRGQNVLFEDNHVEYLHRCSTEDTTDNVFLSDRGYVEAGRHWNDAVIGNSAARPVLVRDALLRAGD